MKSKTVKIQDKSYEVKMMPLGTYSKLMGVLKTIPQHLGKFDELNQEQVIAKLPEMIETSFPELVQILHIATGVPKDALENEIGLTDAVELIEAVFEVNDYDMLGKAIGRLSNKVRVQKATKTG